MAEMSRVKKFKDYRNSLQNNSEDVLLTQPEAAIGNEVITDDTIDNDVKPNTESLSTLSVSYDRIMEAAGKADEKEEIKNAEDKREKIMKIVKISLIVLACVLAVGGLVALGIAIFKM